MASSTPTAGFRKVFDYAKGRGPFDEDDDMEDENGSWSIGEHWYSTWELKVIKLMNSMMNKQNWTKKFLQEEIKNRWKTEISQQYTDTETIEWVFKEADMIASRLGSECTYEPIAIDGVFKADNTIPEDLHKALVAQTQRLRESFTEPDFHPDSEDMVLDLVHPALFCFVSGRTKELSKPMPSFDAWRWTVGWGKVKEEEEEEEGDVVEGGEAGGEDEDEWEDDLGSFNYPLMASRPKCRWLPADFDVDAEGKVKAASYINNLHPEDFKDLYGTLETLLEKFLPLFEATLTATRFPHERRVDPEREEEMQEEHYEDPDEPNPWGNDGEEPFRLPDFDRFKSEWGSKEDQRGAVGEKTVKLRDRRLQVIVKIASVELDRAKGNVQFDNSHWHVEGTPDEQIAATGIYYFNSEGLAEDPFLHFRTAVKTPNPMECPQNAGTSFGLGFEDPLNQLLGAVSTPEGRMLTFPNVYQHKLGSVDLAEGEPKGRRQMVVFFLVDPELPVLSSSTVPPQQSSWFGRAMRERGLLKKLGERIAKVLLDGNKHLSEPMSLSEAKEWRSVLMKERKFVVNQAMDQIFERPCSLCEH
uniref:DUF4246 domain-containing protein n=1 Tax=Chromera velia CCMP2878 TaxID=1169474 RepID=A0A0G4HK74_9ALVE|eukprot:Cvel_1116.t1-p1 / transcript=Cvel_1116.t1 / gene=Cvel_1116 / organism=Chromera_velia_CCMP2878 / gene_product=hypothetical protein / transcript_product=hypothetical protein / location=Cvel_scaffold36:146628-151444(+) / protein_length=584 / sequence_SO=supercontig / SO=protein_coding / is_pseudo=false